MYYKYVTRGLPALRWVFPESHRFVAVPVTS